MKRSFWIVFGLATAIGLLAASQLYIARMGEQYPYEEFPRSRRQGDAMRLCCHAWNSEGEVDRAVDAIRRV